jgi:uncharacterized protein
MSQLPFPQAILRQHSVALGKTGAGKSSAMRVIVEHQLDAKKRVVIIDPKGDWWGLKSSADGKSAGYPIICFGNFKEERATDVPINERSGKHVAELIAAGNRPCVIGFRGWMPAPMTTFWLDFAPTLFNANEGELYVVIDEVHNFAPKGKIMDPNSGKALHWTNRIMSEGRGLGMTFLIASQRPQKVHNDTLENCETLIAMRVTHPRSREATEEWINAKGDPKLGQEVVSTLAQLKTGEAWVWSPDNDFGPKRVQFPMFGTFDSFAPPQLQKKVNQAGWSEVDLDQVREKLATVIAEAEANDPRKLKQKIADLQKELKAKPAATPDPVHTPNAERDAKIAERAAKAAIAPLLKHLSKFQRIAKKTGDLLGVAANELNGISSAELPPEETPAPVLASTPRVELRAAQVPPKRSTRDSYIPPKAENGNGHTSLPIGERAILIAVAQFGEVERDQLTVLTGYKRSSRDAYIARLATKGYLDASGRTLRITQEGADALGSDYAPLPTGSDLYQFWRGRLPEGELRILDVLVEAGPGNAIGRNDLDEPTGYKRSSRDAYLSRLAARRLVETPGSGLVMAAGALFD